MATQPLADCDLGETNLDDSDVEGSGLFLVSHQRQTDKRGRNAGERVTASWSYYVIELLLATLFLSCFCLASSEAGQGRSTLGPPLEVGAPR